MAELNKILLIGRLTKDPDLRYTPSGMAVAKLRMAVNHTYRSKEEKKTEVLFIDVNVWGRGAETVKKYVTKGRELFVEGRLQTDEWTDKQGQKRVSYQVNCDNFQFMGGGRSTEADGSQGAAYDGSDGGAGGGGGGGGGSGGFADPGDGGERREGPPAQQREDDLPF
jgi:single-strand DNA-binding protein